jgi:ribosomal protein S3
MGQKINPYIFRLGFKDNLWNSNHINSNFEEFSLFVYQDIQIKNYISKFFKQNKIHLHFCKIFRSQTELFIFISFYVSSKSINLITQINLIQKLLKRLWTIFLLKKKINTTENCYKNFDFIEQLLECLNIFTKKTLDINIVLQQLNNKNLFLLFNYKTEFLKNSLIKLRKYSNSLFFKESLNILSIAITKKNSAKLIAEFLAFQFSVIKKHNFFLNFLKRALILFVTSNFSFIQGLKILIKGRLNGKLRAKSRLLLIGKIPLQTINSKISYSTSVSYSLYGTFGFKIWICEK